MKNASQMSALEFARVERAIRTIRQRIFDMPEAKQARAGLAIERFKNQIYPRQKSGNYHWMYAAE
jgi:hypothetical protein